MTQASTTQYPMTPRFTLKQRALKAGIWAASGQVGAQVLRLAGSLVMTRLLVPEMFGVMAIAFIFMTGLAMLSDLGLSHNIVQSRRIDDSAFLRTAWTVQVLRSLLICFMGLGCALGLHLGVGLFPTDSAYANPALPIVLAALAPIALVTGLESNGLALARRNLQQSLLVRLDLFCTVVSLLVMVGWAMAERSIWALVAGAYASTLTRTILSHWVLDGPRVGLCWDRSSLKEIREFGQWIMLSSLMGFFAIQGDRILLGGLVNAETLGIYSIAATLAGAFDMLINKIVADIALPALSEIARTRRDDLRSVLYRLNRVIGGGAFLVAGGLLASGPIWIDLLFDDRYRDAGWMLGIIAIAFMTTPSRIVTQCFLALGNSRPIGVLTLARLPILYLLTPLAFHFYGLHGALWAIAASALTNIPLAWWFQARAGLMDMRKEATIWLAVPAGWLVGFAVAALYARIVA